MCALKNPEQIANDGAPNRGEIERLQRRGIAWSVPILVLLALLVVYSSRAHHHHAAGRPFLPFGASPSVQPLPLRIKRLDAGSEQGSTLWSTLQPRRSPMYVANLATTVGHYVVSVRQVIGSSTVQTLYRNASSTWGWPQLRELKISLQILAPNARLLARVRDFTANLQGMDDQGRRVSTLDTGPTVAFANGRARILLLSDPSAHSRLLRWLQGDVLLLRPDGTTERLTFRITNVPLPVENHVFGIVYASQHLEKLPAWPAQHPGNGVVLYTHAQALALRPAFTPFVPDPNPFKLPTRLLLVNGEPGRFVVYPSAKGHALAAEAIHCSLRPRVEDDGAIPVEFSLTDSVGGEHRTALPIWDSEPVVLAIPRSTMEGARSGNGYWLFWIDLYLEMPPQEHTEASVTVNLFPLPPGGRGGTLAGTILVKDEPLEWGRVYLQVGPVDAQARPTAPPILAEVPLEGNGRWHVANLAPGNYRVSVARLEPVWPLLEHGCSIETYAHHRYGIQNLLWEGREQVATVRMGGYSELKPLHIVESKAAAKAAH